MQNPEILTTPYYVSTSVSYAAPKRIAEFSAGRSCAVKAIQAFRPGWIGQVDMNADGSPRWPEGLVGSITHTQGFAAAAVAPSDIWLSIGIDSEKMADAEILKAAKEIVIREDEQRLSARLPIPEDQFILLVFSAKESIYKCLSPVIKRPLEFGNVILKDINFQKSTFNFHLTESIKPELWSSADALGRFQFLHGCVHTGVELRRPPS